MKIKQDNYYCYRGTGQFKCDRFKMDLQKSIKVFFNINEVASSDQIDLYFDKFVSGFSSSLYKYAPRKRASQKKLKYPN